MDKFNKEDLPLLFKSVSLVLGEEEAEKQLSIAYESYSGHSCGFEDHVYVSAAFEWIETEQGYEYWSHISERLDFMMKVDEDE